MPGMLDESKHRKAGNRPRREVDGRDRMDVAQAWLASIVSSSDDAIIGKTLDGGITSWNHAAELLYGYTADEAIGRPIELIVPGDRKGELRGILDKIRRGERVEHYETVRVTKDGRRIDVSITISPIIDPAGHIIGASAIARDITTRKQTEEALRKARDELELKVEQRTASLRESEQKFHILADSTYDWVVWSSPKGNYIYVSPSCERITGHRADEFYNDPGLLERIVHPDDRKAFEQHTGSHLRSESLYGNFDFRIISTSGETRWINHVCRPVFRDNGEWLGRRTSNRDITARKTMEESLRKLSMAVEQSPESIVITDVNGKIEYVNPMFTKITGYAFDEALGQNPRILKSGKTSESTYKKLWETILSGHVWRGELLNKKKNGEYYCESASIAPVKDDRGQITHFVAVKLDITERKHMEEELRRSRNELERRVRERTRELCESEANLATAQSIAHIGNFSLDITKDRAQCSDEFYRILGLEPQDHFSYTRFLPYIHPDDREKLDKMMHEVWDQGKSRQMEFRVVRADGQVRFIYGDCSLIVGEAGGMIFGTMQDITERKRAEEELKESYEKLKDLDKTKMEFFTLISHELRNPLSVIKGFTELLYDGMLGPVNDKQKDKLSRVQENVDKLTDIIGKMTDITSFEMRQYPVNKVPTSIYDMVNKLIDTMGFLFKNKHITVKVDMPADLHLVEIDPKRIEQVLLNLLNNAQKYTPEGGHVTISARDRDADILVSVKDTGIGIAKKDLDQIFSGFYHSGYKLSYEYKGPGLGLAVSRKIIESHGGHIWAESEEGEGSAFYFTIPKHAKSIETAGTEAVESR